MFSLETHAVKLVQEPSQNTSNKRSRQTRSQKLHQRLMVHQVHARLRFSVQMSDKLSVRHKLAGAVI